MCAEYNLAKALSTCMKLPELMNLEVLEGSTRVLAHTGLIDPVENLSRIRAYFYGGTKDTIVVPGMVTQQCFNMQFYGASRSFDLFTASEQDFLYPFCILVYDFIFYLFLDSTFLH